MKLFGSIGELVSLVFRLAGGKEVKVTSAAQTGGSVTPAVPVEIEIPDVGAGGSDVFVTEGAVQTLTNKTIDANGTGNSITNLEEADFQTKLADANKVLTRNASGAVTSAAITNANVDAAAAIAESKLALSYSTSSLNSALDTKLDDFASTNDSRVVLTSGTSGNAVKESAVTINGLGELSGATRLDVDNVRTDGNTISSTNTNGPLTIEAAGTATVRGVGGDVILDATDDAIQLIGANVLLRDGASLGLFDDSNANSVLITVPAALSQDRYPQIPDAAGNFVLEQGSQILYDKTISGNNNTLTVLAASQLSGAVPVANGGTGQTSQTAAFDALAPTTTQGDTIYHNGTDNVRLAKGSAGQVLTMNSGATAPEWADAGGGSGEKNYVENPSAASAITGWVNVGDLDVARTTTAAELPREYTTGSGIKITADTNPQSAADYVYYDFTLDDVDLNKKLKIEWAQKVIGGYVNGTLQVVITTQADRTTALHTPDVSAIPSYDGVFQASFDSANTAALSLVIRGTSTDMATGAGIVISDVIVGPGRIQAVPAIGTWENFTPITNIGGPPVRSQKRRVGSNLEMNITWENVSAWGASIWTLTLPDSLTVDMTNSALANFTIVGNALGYDAAPGWYDTVVEVASSTSLRISNWYNAAPFAWQNGNDRLSVQVSVPIAQWAGSPNYAGQNDVVYVAVNSTWDADDTSVASLVYGQTGVQTGGALTASRTKRVRGPAGWIPTVQLQTQTGGGWVNASDILPRNRENTAESGVTVGSVSGSTTDYDVIFRQYQILNGGTFGAAGVAWGTAYYWRVAFVRPGAAVGFGLATQTSAGLVKMDSGATTNNVGEYETGTWTPSVSSGTASLTVASAKYTRIGNIVTASASFFLTKGTGSGNISFLGLPHAATSSTNYRSLAVTYQDQTSATWNVMVSASGTSLALQSDSAGTAITYAAISDTRSFRFTITYITD